MWPTASNPEAGKWLRAQRERLRLSTRDVERLSFKIAQDKNSQDFCLSHNWLTEIENGKFTPNFCKLYSLCVIYKCDLDQILAFFRIRLRDISKEQRSVTLPHTHLLGTSLKSAAATIVAPLELRAKVRLEQTNLVSRMFESWGEIPRTQLEQMDLRHSLYG